MTLAWTMLAHAAWMAGGATLLLLAQGGVARIRARRAAREEWDSY